MTRVPKRGRRTIHTRKTSPGRSRLPAKQAREVSDRLRTWYRRHFGSQSEFAEALGIAESTVSGWFGGQRRAPDPRSLAILADLGLSLDWLFTGEGPESRRASQPIGAVAEAIRDHVRSALMSGRWNTRRRFVDERLPTGEAMLEATVAHYGDVLDGAARILREQRTAALRSAAIRLAGAPTAGAHDRAMLLALNGEALPANPTAAEKLSHSVWLAELESDGGSDSSEPPAQPSDGSDHEAGFRFVPRDQDAELAAASAMRRKVSVKQHSGEE